MMMVIYVAYLWINAQSLSPTSAKQFSYCGENVEREPTGSIKCKQFKFIIIIEVPSRFTIKPPVWRSGTVQLHEWMDDS